MRDFTPSTRFNNLKIANHASIIARIVFIGLILITSFQSNLTSAAEEIYTPPFDFLIDHNGDATLELILKDPEEFVFSHVENGIFRDGFSENIYWFRIRIPPLRSQRGSYFLKILPPTLDSIEFYYPNSNGDFKVKRGGDSIPPNIWDIPYRSTVFELELPAKETFGYIRLKTKSQIAIEFSIISTYKFLKIATNESIIYGGILGILTTALIVNSINLLWVLDKVYRYYVVHLFFLILWIIGYEGIINLLPFSTSEFVNKSTENFTYLMILSSSLYYGSLFLDKHDKSNVILYFTYYPLNISLALGMAVTLLNIELPIESIFGKIIGYAIFNSIIMIVLGYFSLNRKNRYFAIGNTSVHKASLLSLLFTTLMAIAVITIDILKISTALYVYFLSELFVIIFFQISYKDKNKDIKKSEMYQITQKELALENMEKEKSIATMQSRFLAIIYHEIRTPLSIIRIALSTKNPSENVKNYAKDAISNIDRIIERCAYSSKFNDSAIKPTIETFDLTYLVNNLRNSEFKNQPIDFSDDHKIFEIKSDSEFITIALRNLIENSIKYKIKDSRISIEIKALEIGVRKLTYFTIRNKLHNPQEIDEEKIFDRYVRGPSAEKTSGSGLGLFIVKGLLESVYAEITCHINDKGIEFKICF